MIKEISQLYHLKETDPSKALKQACQEFESIFTYQLMKVMGKSVPEGFLGDGLAGSIYKDMLYLNIAKEISKGNGLGIGSILYNQIQQARKT